ncbi:unnamed protein product [Dibothriocephalus latus]|uniref:ATPase family AAA domain-containing protein n=1 Tax=Dibothriocephalus latus TaxID=60516 RepID=A0A3P7P9G9_DIBLA|nr:unnamed protein product [Dibothriocephalus latus]
MSWLFGYSRPQPSGNAPPGDGMGLPQPPPPKEDKKKMEEAISGFRFDSAALERAAKAAKELEASSNLSLPLYTLKNMQKKPFSSQNSKKRRNKWNTRLKLRSMKPLLSN